MQKDAHFYFLESMLFLCLFAGLSHILYGYETIMNAGLPVNTINLFNEGPIGYALLFGVGASAFMFFKDFLNFTKALQLLASIGSNPTSEGVNV